jgi:hypothetical protein
MAAWDMEAIECTARAYIKNQHAGFRLATESNLQNLFRRKNARGQSKGSRGR